MKDLVVYLLVRTDLPSLNSGKGFAQTHHAGVQMAVKFADHPLFKEYLEFGNQQGADNFNTTISLGATFKDIENTMEKVTKMNGVCGILIDPSYPFLVDSELDPFLGDVAKLARVKTIDSRNVLYTRPELTCAYALGDRNDPEFYEIFRGLNLHI